MVLKLNCWEFKNCGRQPGGNKTDESGICPAAVNGLTHGINNGINAGRACWVIEGTLCHGERAKNFSQKLKTCLKCDFYEEVRHGEGNDFQNSKKIINVLNGSRNKSNMKTNTPISAENEK